MKPSSISVGCQPGGPILRPLHFDEVGVHVGLLPAPPPLRSKSTHVLLKLFRRHACSRACARGCTEICRHACSRACARGCSSEQGGAPATKAVRTIMVCLLTVLAQTPPPDRSKLNGRCLSSGDGRRGGEVPGGGREGGGSPSHFEPPHPIGQN